MDDETRSLRTAPQPENKSSPGPVSPDAAISTNGSLHATNQPREKSHQDHSRFRTEKAKHIAIWVALAFAILILIGVVPRLIRRHTLANEKASEHNEVPSVTVILAQPVPPHVDLELSGTMSPLTEAPVLSRSSGYLVKRLVDIGDHVHKNQLLAVVDAPDLDQQVSQARAALQESQSALDQAKSGLDQSRANEGLAAISAQRFARLQEKGAVSRQENDTYQSQYKAQSATVSASDANVQTATHNIASSEANLQRLIDLQQFEQVRSPFDGLVTERNLDIGSLITEASTLLFRVAQIDVLRTYIEVPQTNSPFVKDGDVSWVSFAEYPDRSFQGTITRRADALDPTTRTMLTEVQLPNPDHLLLPGMYATVKLIVPHAGGAVLIPGESMILRAQGPLVAIVTDQNTIHLQTIDIGHDYGNTLEVLNGLKPGQNVVVNPGDAVVEGAKVNPVVSQEQIENPNATGTGTPGQTPPGSQAQPGSPSQKGQAQNGGGQPQGQQQSPQSQEQDQSQSQSQGQSNQQSKSNSSSSRQ